MGLTDTSLGSGRRARPVCRWPQPPFTGPDPAGFWMGLWQGFISPVTLIVSPSLFTDQVSIYEVQNSGNWYDVGFMIGVSAIFGGGLGGGAAGRRR